MFCRCPIFLFITVALSALLSAQQMHDHAMTEKLGEVSFPTSCQAAVQGEFNRGVALLHSFAYAAAKKAFQNVADRDPNCAMAHWGVAMSYFHQLWEPPIAPGSEPSAQQEIEQGRKLGAANERDRKLLEAAGLIFQNAGSVPYPARAANYEQAMRDLARENKDVEVQVFYALALLANASPMDKTHARQKQAAGLLEPLFRANPQHPGVAHYLIHAYDNAELAQRGLEAARLYSKIAPSMPHALHMPSHIFTRLGLWDESIASNTAARDAARAMGDTGEELHAMDYLVYAHLQLGHEEEAAQVLQQLKGMAKLDTRDFKIGYAATAMPIRYAVERQAWAEAANIVPPGAAPPHVIAIAVWARGVGLARSGHAEPARKAADDLARIERELEASGNAYWATQVRVMKREVMAWSAQANHQDSDAARLLRQAADEEDSVEKLPVTPGPIVPAREQLGQLFLAQGQPKLAAGEFKTALANAPGRRGAALGAAQASAPMSQR